MSLNKLLFIGDVHLGDEDPQALQVALDFASDFKPDCCYLIGDILDCYAVSKYDKNPEKELGLAEELEKLDSLLDALKPSCKKIIYFAGNHEERINKYRHDHREIFPLKSLEIPNLLGLNKRKIAYVPYADSLYQSQFCITHGACTRKHSAATARLMVDDFNCSGISGHTHRLGAFHVTNRRGKQCVWYENGHLQNPDPEYTNGVPNWQQGFSFGYFDKNLEKHHLYQVAINHGTAVINNKLYASPLAVSN